MKGRGVWRDCDTIPFEYAVHLAQHNERTLGRLFRLHKDQRNELRYHQRWRRFAGAAEYTDEKRGNPVAGWLGAMGLLHGTGMALVYDDEKNVITTPKLV